MAAIDEEGVDTAVVDAAIVVVVVDVVVVDVAVQSSITFYLDTGKSRNLAKR